MEKTATVVTFVALVTMVQCWMPASLSSLHRNRRDRDECRKCAMMMDSKDVDPNNFSDPAYFESMCTAATPALDCMSQLGPDCNGAEVPMAKFVCDHSEDFAALLDCWQQRGHTIEDVFGSCNPRFRRQAAENLNTNWVCFLYETMSRCLQSQAEGCPASSAQALKEASDLLMSKSGCLQ